MCLREQSRRVGVRTLCLLGVVGEFDDDLPNTGGLCAVELEDAVAVLRIRDPDCVPSRRQRQAPERRADTMIDPIHVDDSPRHDLQLVAGLPWHCAWRQGSSRADGSPVLRWRRCGHAGRRGWRDLFRRTAGCTGSLGLDLGCALVRISTSTARRAPRRRAGGRIPDRIACRIPSQASVRAPCHAANLAAGCVGRCHGCGGVARIV